MLFITRRKLFMGMNWSILDALGFLVPRRYANSQNVLHKFLQLQRVMRPLQKCSLSTGRWRNNDSQTHPKEGGFIKAMAKIEGHESFPKMLRNSPFVQMGDPQGKILEGTIVHTVEDDLYIDFGGKFNCVCPRPQKNGQVYRVGKKVRVLIHDLELSTRFLGAKTDLTILEADGTLLGLLGKAEHRDADAASNS